MFLTGFCHSRYNCIVYFFFGSIIKSFCLKQFCYIKVTGFIVPVLYCILPVLYYIVFCIRQIKKPFFEYVKIIKGIFFSFLGIKMVTSHNSFSLKQQIFAKVTATFKLKQHQNLLIKIKRMSEVCWGKCMKLYYTCLEQQQ